MAYMPNDNNIPIKWVSYRPCTKNDELIVKFYWADYDSCPYYCCNSGPVDGYVFKAIGIDFDSFCIIIQKDSYDDYKCKVSFIKISINQIDDFICEYGWITSHSNYSGYNSPEAMNFMRHVKKVQFLWKNNPTLTWNEIITLYKKKK